MGLNPHHLLFLHMIITAFRSICSSIFPGAVAKLTSLVISPCSSWRQEWCLPFSSLFLALSISWSPWLLCCALFFWLRTQLCWNNHILVLLEGIRDICYNTFSCTPQGQSGCCVGILFLIYLALPREELSQGKNQLSWIYLLSFWEGAATAFLKEQLDYAQTLSPPPAMFVVTVFTLT